MNDQDTTASLVEFANPSYSLFVDIISSAIGRRQVPPDKP
jgi:hypothetical protein